MRQLDHPNIVKLIDFSESRQYYYIVLELCPGGELFHQIVRLTYFSEELSRHVIVQVAEALEYLHEVSGVVHRYVPRYHQVRIIADYGLVISNQRTSYSTQYRSYQRRTQGLSPPRTKTRQMKVNLSKASEPVASAPLRLPTLDFPRSSGTAKP